MSKSKWIKVYEAFEDLSAREQCAVLEAARLPIPKILLNKIESEKHFPKMKVTNHNV